MGLGAALRGVITPLQKDRLFATRRLRKELDRLWADPPEWCIPGADATDLFHWQAIIVAPEGSPYDGGVFAVRIKFPRDYPFKAPKVTFETMVYHPNIDPRTGRICLDFLTAKHWWTPAWSVDRILLVIVSLLYEPVMDGVAINLGAAHLYKSKRLRYEEIAREKTREHASVSPSPDESYSEKKHPSPSSWAFFLRHQLRAAFLPHKSVL